MTTKVNDSRLNCSNHNPSTLCARNSIMMDSIAQIHNDPDLQWLQTECNLHNIHQTKPAPSTCIGSEAWPIDHMFGCSQLIKSVTCSGSLSYLDGPKSNHRGLFVDINPIPILGQPLIDQDICLPHSRSLKSGNLELVEDYHKTMHQYYTDQNTLEKIQKLFDTYTNISRSHIKKCLEKWGSKQGRAMAHAKSIITKPWKPYSCPQHFKTWVLYTNTGGCTTGKKKSWG